MDWDRIKIDLQLVCDHLRGGSFVAIERGWGLCFAIFHVLLLDHCTVLVGRRVWCASFPLDSDASVSVVRSHHFSFDLHKLLWFLTFKHAVYVSSTILTSLLWDVINPLLFDSWMLLRFVLTSLFLNFSNEVAAPLKNVRFLDVVWQVHLQVERWVLFDDFYQYSRGWFPIEVLHFTFSTFHFRVLTSGIDSSWW